MKLPNRDGLDHAVRAVGRRAALAPGLIASVLAMGTATPAEAAMPSYTSGFARFSSTSDTIQVLGNTVFNQGDFTYEMHIRFRSGAASGRIISEQRNTYEDKSIHLDADGNYVMTAAYSSLVTGANLGQIAGFPQAEEWMHLAYVRNGGALTIYLNGVSAATHTVVGSYGDRSDSWMAIGMHRDGVGYPGSGYPVRPSFLGDLDWIRVSASAIYTSNFTPPTESAISAGATTQLLYKFNEAAGTTTIYDESSNSFQGNLGVPVYPGVTATAPTLMTGVVPSPGVIALAGLAGLTSSRRRKW
jgi:hypothetical protein